MARRVVMVIEDEPDILEVIQYNLGREGFEVHGAAEGQEGLARVRQILPDVVLLDLMLPGLDGIEICRQLKADPLTRAIPVIMVTAKGGESDVVLGLGVGADDYVVKPFSPRVLLARVQAALRRTAAPQRQADLRRVVQGGLVIDTERHEVSLEGRPVSLTATEFRLLYHLAAHPGRVFTREQLLARTIGERAVVLGRNIDVHVRAIRRKLESYGDAIETVRGVGYRFSEAVCGRLLAASKDLKPRASAEGVPRRAGALGPADEPQRGGVLDDETGGKPGH